MAPRPADPRLSSSKIVRLHRSCRFHRGATPPAGIRARYHDPDAKAVKGGPFMLANEVLSFIEDNDVKFIRLAFTDLFGQLRNIAILPDQLAAAMESGVAIDATAVPGCAAAPGGTLLLRPDPDTLCILPWRPQSGRVCRLLCDLLTPQGDPFPNDIRPGEALFSFFDQS